MNLKNNVNYEFWLEVAKIIREQFSDFIVLSDETEIYLDAQFPVNSDQVFIVGFFQFGDKKWGKIKVNYNSLNKSIYNVKFELFYNLKIFEAEFPKIQSDQTFKLI